MASDHDSDWIWNALASGEESVLEGAHVDYFDWNGTHALFGTPLIALILGHGHTHSNDLICNLPERARERLNLMKLVLKKGGSPHKKPPRGFTRAGKSWTHHWHVQGKADISTKALHFEGLSAYGVVVALLEAMANDKGAFKNPEKNMRDAAKVLASYRPPSSRFGVCRVPVALVVVEMWEDIMNTQGSADVTIVCRGGPEEENAEVRVTAHKVVLCAASRVLRAMLSTSFKEGGTANVNVDCGAAPVRLLLSQIYTGEEVDDAESPPDVVLSSMELAHQWDVGHAVAALEAAAAKAIDDANFGLAAEAVASRLRLQQLTDACAAFAKASEHVKAQFEASCYPAAVQALLAQVFGEPSEPKRKRRRVNVEE